jgi:hypothetical protein
MSATIRAVIPPPVELLDAEPGAFWFGTFHNLNILVWLRAATKEAIERLDRTNPARTRAHPERISTIHIITERASPAGGEARAALEKMNARWGHTVGCAAVVIELSGFAGVMMRTAVTGVTMIAPKNYRIRVFDGIDSAAPWLSKEHARSTQVAFAAPAVLSALRAARNSALGGAALPLTVPAFGR